MTEEQKFVLEMVERAAGIVAHEYAQRGVNTPYLSLYGV